MTAESSRHSASAFIVNRRLSGHWRVAANLPVSEILQGPSRIFRRPDQRTVAIQVVQGDRVAEEQETCLSESVE